MRKKEEILKIVSEAKEIGFTREELLSRVQVSKEVLDKIISQLIKERKVYEADKRIHLIAEKEKYLEAKGGESPGKDDSKKYVTRDELQVQLQEVYERLTELKEEIDRLFDYVGDIYMSIKKESGKPINKPNIEELLMIYDNLNSKFHYKDSVPVSVFKREVMGKYSLTDRQIDEIIIQLEQDEVVHLQEEYGNTKNLGKGIEINGKTFSLITWVKR